jgi:hypothetical protein
VIIPCDGARDETSEAELAEAFKKATANGSLACTGIMMM